MSPLPPAVDPAWCEDERPWVPEEGVLEQDVLVVGLSTCCPLDEDQADLLRKVCVAGLPSVTRPQVYLPDAWAMVFQYSEPSGDVGVALGVAFHRLSSDAATYALGADTLAWALGDFHNLLRRLRWFGVVDHLGIRPHLFLLRRGVLVEAGTDLM